MNTQNRGRQSDDMDDIDEDLPPVNDTDLEDDPEVEETEIEEEEDEEDYSDDSEG